MLFPNIAIRTVIKDNDFIALNDFYRSFNFAVAIAVALSLFVSFFLERSIAIERAIKKINKEEEKIKTLFSRFKMLIAPFLHFGCTNNISVKLGEYALWVKIFTPLSLYMLFRLFDSLLRSVFFSIYYYLC